MMNLFSVHLCPFLLSLMLSTVGGVANSLERISMRNRIRRVYTKLSQVVNSNIFRVDVSVIVY